MDRRLVVAVLSGHSAMTTDTAGMTEPTSGPRPAPITTMVAVLWSLFVGLGLVAHRAAAGTALDHAVLAWMVDHRTPGLTSLAIAVTTVGSPVGVAVIAVVAAGLSWWRRGSPRPAMLILTTLAVAGALSTLSKIIVGAHRPGQAVQLVVETDPSFPSGHVTGTLALMGALVVVIGHRSRRAVCAAVVLAAMVTAAVALTRLYLGVHWVTDIVGGLLLGGSAVVLAYVAYQRMIGPLDTDDGGGALALSGPATAVGT